MSRRAASSLVCAASALFLAGCGIDTYLGVTEDETPLPGRRISVLALENALSPDTAVAGIPVRLPSPYVNAEWTQAGGTSAHAMFHLALSEAPQEIWRADIGEGNDDDARILAQPVVADGRVFTLDARATVKAFDAASGKEIWAVEINPEEEEDGFFGGGLAYENGRLFIATGFAQAVALEAGTGTEVWRSNLPTPMRSGPAVSGGRVFMVTLKNQMIVLAADDGRELWTHSGIEEAAGLLGSATPAVAGEIVVVPYSSGEIYGLLVDNGRVVWSDSLASVRRSDPIGDMADIRGLPVIDRGGVFAVSHSGRMVAIDLRRGARAWERQIGGVETPWIGGDFLFMLTRDQQLVSITRQAGAIRWVQPLPRFEDPEDQDDPIQWYGPVLASDRLIVAGSHGQVLTVSPYTGELLGTIELSDGIALTPIVAGETLFLVTSDGDLVALR